MLVDTFDYLTDYDPAMPIIEVMIGAAGTAPMLRVNALVDSGADGSILPLQQLKQIDARKYQKKWMRTVTGQRAQVDMYLVTVQIGRLQPVRLAVAGDPQLDEAIIGRDLLNQLVVRLDGPAMVVEIFAL
ncbi:MAG: retroviral-like aspartic protease family protein [Caldilineaceae bacterium]